MFRSSLQALDRILRGEATQPAALRMGPLDVPLAGLATVILALTMFYGACMGVYAGFRAEGSDPAQWFACTVKVPMLFFLTLGVTFPSLYVFNALVGSRLHVVVLAQLLIASLGVNVAVLASMGTIVAFFSLGTSSYPFMVLLNVFVFGISGVFGLTFLLRTLQRLSVTWDETPTETSSALEGPPHQGLGRGVRVVFFCWIAIFCLVGAQMAWVLRPFFGAPDHPFAWFRPRSSNFFEGVLQALRHLFS